ncbi:MAG: PIN domain-containing protein [Thermoplasmataceae archaeon]
MTDFITDTVALARYLEDSLPNAASAAFGQAERGEGSILVPQIVVGEFIYIAMKGRLKVADPKSSIKLVLEELRGTSFIFQSVFPEEAWDNFLSLEVPELHDRLIASEAQYRNIPLISNDPAFHEIPNLKTIWK